jgi:hypothetical protein
VRVHCGVFGDGHQVSGHFTAGFGRTAEPVEVEEMRAVGETGVRLRLSDGVQEFGYHDNVGLVETFEDRSGPALLDRDSLLRIPVSGGSLVLPLGINLVNCPLLDRRRAVVREKFDGIVGGLTATGDLGAVHEPAIDVRVRAFPDPPARVDALTCTRIAPGHSIHRQLEYKLKPALAKAPIVETAFVEAGNRIVLRVEGVPYVLHHHDPWGLLHSIRAGKATRWTPPFSTLLVEQHDGGSGLFRVTSEPLTACEDSSPEALRYSAWLAEQLRDDGCAP